MAAKPPSPVVTPVVDTDTPAVQKVQAVIASAKYDAIRHPMAGGATVHPDTEVCTSSTWQRRDNPGTHQHLCQAYPTVGALPSQPTESCEVGVLKAGSELYYG